MQTLKIDIPYSFEYVSDWKDYSGRYEFDKYLLNTPVIVNKQTTGCGFTTYVLVNNENTILVSPRTQLLRNKWESFSGRVFYFNREYDESGKQEIELGDLIMNLGNYIGECHSKNQPVKLLVTYDSFPRLCDLLESNGVPVRDFRIVIDESHCLIKDVQMKEHGINCVISDFLRRLFCYQRLLFVSATPIIEYIRKIDEFKSDFISYLELNWLNKRPVRIKKYKCVSSQNAFKQIFEKYKKDGYFDYKYVPGYGSVISTQAVIYLNSVRDIKKILKKYTITKPEISLSDVSVICARTKENITQLHDELGNGVNILKSIPKEGEPHRTWTFVTRTAFEGCDFYHPCASSYVIANYNVKSLCIDIASDIPQIIGRQRLKSNVFRDTLHLFFTKNIRVVSDEEFREMRQQKIQNTNKQFEIYNHAPDDCKDVALKNIKSSMTCDPLSVYIRIENGVPKMNNLIMLSEDYSRDILKNQHSWFVMSSTSTNQKLYSQPIQDLMEYMIENNGKVSSQQLIKSIYECVMKNPDRKEEILEMLTSEGWETLSYPFQHLSLERVKANGYNMTKMNNEVRFINRSEMIREEIQKDFNNGEVYSKAECKRMLRDIYERLDLCKQAKATDLADYVNCKETKKSGLKAIKVSW